VRVAAFAAYRYPIGYGQNAISNKDKQSGDAGHRPTASCTAC